jgi:Peptidase family M23
MNMPFAFRRRAMAFLFSLLVLALSSSLIRSGAAENMTPVLLAVQDAPVPFVGSDGRAHLVYELWITNSSNANVTVEKVDVIGDGSVIETLDTATVARRLQPIGQRESTGTLAKSTQALLFLHITLPQNGAIPHQLVHRVSLGAEAAPPGQQEISEEGGAITVDLQPVVVVGPPLRGAGYISADSCCDATRHTRAALPVNGRVWIAQRYAVDWEKMDAKGRIYNGPREKLESYAIFGQPVLAVARARVAHVIDGLPEETPGQYPTNIALDKADGNSVILDLGDGRFAMYAHMQPGSIRVHAGDTVELGQVIGLVGNTGNSLAPHLHFQVMQGPSSFASNGLPYAISSFEVKGKTPGTEAFDEAEAKGTPVPITPVSPPQKIVGAMPLDQLIIAFPQ